MVCDGQQPASRRTPAAGCGGAARQGMSSRTVCEPPALASDQVPSLPGTSVQVLQPLAALSALRAGRTWSRVGVRSVVHLFWVRTEPVAAFVTR